MACSKTPPAACINIRAPCRSVYRWQGAVQHEEEHPVLIKTTRAAYAELEAEIRAHIRRG